MSNFNWSFIQEIIKYKSVSRLLTILNFASSFLCFYLLLVTPKGLNKITLSFLGLVSGIGGAAISKVDSELDSRLEDLKLTSRLSSKELLGDYLKDKQQITVEVSSPPVGERELIEDIVDYWLKSDKHLMIIGGTGDGKSTAIKYIISQLADWNITAYDVDYKQEDYSNQIHVKYEYKSIKESMEDEIEELEIRISERRNTSGKYSDTPKLTIAEELPALALEIGDTVNKWIRVKSSRGRKVFLKLACIAQNDTAESLALKGNIGMRDNNFILLYLGKKAIEKAQRNKDDQLVDWLRAASHGRGILNGFPCTISINNLQVTSSVISDSLQSDSSKPALEASGSGNLTGIQATEVENLEPTLVDKSPTNSSEITRKDLLCAIELISQGHSRTEIIRRVWGVESGRKFTEISRAIQNKINQIADIQNS